MRLSNFTHQTRNIPMIRKMTLALGLALILSACNTVAGIGEDVQSVGETVTDVAD